MTKHLDLYAPFTLGGLALPNRLVMAPMTRTRAGEGGVPVPLNAEYYAQRASAGLIVTECTAVSPDSAGIMRAPGIHTDAQVQGWRGVVDAVHQAGGRVYLQVWHCGRISHASLQPGGEAPVAPSAIAAEGQIFTPQGRVPFTTPRALETAEIPAIVEAFGRATTNAKAAGFDGVELHGAFGYLPDQFLQDGTNRRTDRYGGPVENRARFMLETVEAMIGAWSPERVGVKLSPSSRFYGQRDGDALGTWGHVVRALDGLRVGYVHLMEPNEADLKSGTVQLREVTGTLRPLFRSGAVITNGGYDKAKADAALADGRADLVSFGVPYVANPDLAARLRRDPPPLLNKPDPATFYGEGPGGYTDYPALAA
jgi:N-ethylmaleimide reductase